MVKTELSGLAMRDSPWEPPVSGSRFSVTSWIRMAMPKVAMARKSPRSRIVSRPISSAASAVSAIAPAIPTIHGSPKLPRYCGCGAAVMMACV